MPIYATHSTESRLDCPWQFNSYREDYGKFGASFTRITQGNTSILVPCHSQQELPSTGNLSALISFYAVPSHL